MESMEHWHHDGMVHGDCPYCRQVRAARAYGGGSRAARRAGAHLTRLERERLRRRRARMGYAAVSLAVLFVLSATMGIMGFTYLRDGGAKASVPAVSPAGEGEGAAAAGGERAEGASRLSEEDEGIIRYLAVEYAAGKGYPGLSVLGLSSNGIAASVTLADGSGRAAFVVEVVRGGRTHEWLCVDLRPAP